MANWDLSILSVIFRSSQLEAFQLNTLWEINVCSVIYIS